MSISFLTTFRRSALMLAVAASCFAARASFAYTLEAQQMCTGDAFRLCAGEIPDIPKITACMIRHRADLSAPCRTVLDRDMASKSKVAQK